MTAPLSNLEKNRKLPWALTGDAFGVVYVYMAAGGAVFLLFLDHLKLDKSQIGLLLSFSSFGGLIAIFSGPLASRLGVKRIFVSFWLLRKVILAGLIFAPWVLVRWGPHVGFWYVACIIGGYALCRSVGESAMTLWSHEYIPANRRGKFTALQTVVIMVIGAAAVAATGYFLGKDPQTRIFQILFAAALGFGLVSVFCYAHLPGGWPLPLGPHEKRGFKPYLEPFRDTRFRKLLVGSALVNLGWGVMAAFMPLYYRDHIHLRADQVVILDAVYMIGQLCTCFLWGWTADRYGGKSQMVLFLALLVFFPIALMLLPRDSPLSNPGAWAIQFTLGLIMPGWSIGFGRTLYVDLIPAHKKMIYLPLYGTLGAAVVGISPLLAGFALDYIPAFNYTVAGFHLDVYSPLFIVCIVCLLAAAAIFSTISTTQSLPVSTFASMFIQGNPIAAVQAIIAYQFAGQENKRIITVERLGQTNSPLGIEELVSSLFDPSFNVRYEAIVSVARTRQKNPRLTEAMVRVLTLGTPELRAVAAWALGRMGDKNAGEALTQMLESPYPLLRSRAARALGTLNYTESSPKILAMFHEEKDKGIAVAYLTALAALGQNQVISQMLDFLRDCQDPAIRQETALAISTLLGPDEQAMRLWRKMLAEPGDTLGGVMLGLRKRLTQAAVARPATGKADAKQLAKAIDRCTRHLSMEQYEESIYDVIQIIEGVRAEAFTPVAQIILQQIDDALKNFGVTRVEYLFLAVHTLHVGMTSAARNAAI